jgi:hypothetical protein
MTWLFSSDPILDKARCAEDLKPFGRQSTLSGRSILIMEIVCSISATVWTLVQHRPDAALFRKEFQRIWKAGCIVVRPDALIYHLEVA